MNAATVRPGVEVRPQLAQGRAQWLKAVWPLLISLFCCALLVGVYSRPIQQRYEVGTADVALTGLYAPEQNDRFSYAYIQSAVPLTLPNVGQGTFATSLRIGGPNADVPVAVQLGMPAQHVHLGSVQALRVYHILVPTDAKGAFNVRLESTTARLATDTRQLGALVDWIDIRSLGRLTPPVIPLVGIPLTLLLVWLFGRRVIKPYTLRLATLGLTAIILCLGYALGRGTTAVAPGWMVGVGLGVGASALGLRLMRDAQWRSWLRSARWLHVSLLVFGVTRMGIALVAYLAEPGFVDAPYVTGAHLKPENILLDVFGSRWDSPLYLEIVERGYRFDEPGVPTVPYFPLLPLLLGGVAFLLGNAHILAGGLLITNLALLGATMLLYRLADREWGSAVADRAVWYLLIFPTSFFGSAIYSESLLLLGAVGALYCARIGRWRLAILPALMVGLARPVGITVAAILVAEWWMQRRDTARHGQAPLVGLLAPAAVFVGTGAYMLYLYYAFGDPLAFVHAVSKFGRTRSVLTMLSDLVERPGTGWKAALLVGQVQVGQWIDALAVLSFTVLGGVLVHRRRWSEGAFILLNVLILINSGLWASQLRYVWVLFPGYILLAQWGARPWIDRTLTIVFLLGLGVFLTYFANWYWAG